jgi:hypothetical protein
MMTARQAAFREAYRAKIAPLYSGALHVALIYLIGGAVIWLAARHIHRPRLDEWLVVPVAFLGCNIFEWFLHKEIMHKPRRLFMGIYRRHTLAHHQFFTDTAPHFDGWRDFRIVFFPPYALIIFIMMSALGAAVLDFLWSANAAWLLMATTSAVYLNYEFFHLCCHVKDDRLVRRIPFINTIRRHHIAHHDMAIMMHCNMNLTYPIADWLFGTSDLDRGFWGHIFNGYDQSHRRRDRAAMPLSGD